MIFNSKELKQEARGALRGNWQTAMLVSFCAGIFATAAELVQVPVPLDLNTINSEAFVETVRASLLAVPQSTWTLLGLFNILNFLFTPVLSLGCNHYFIRRMSGEELGFYGLFSRKKLVGKALLLSIVTTLRIIAWSFLFLIPGLMASLRYSQAPYYLAEDPSLSVTEAIRRSKKAMKGNLGNLFYLSLSFLGWILLCFAAQYFLTGVHMILSLVVYQFSMLAVQTYINGTYAAFFLELNQEFTLQTAAGEPGTGWNAASADKE